MSAHQSKRPRLLRGELPTEPIVMSDLLRRTPYSFTQPSAAPTEATPEDVAMRKAVDLASRVGEIMLRCGAGAPQVQGAVAAVVSASGLKRVDLDITLQSLLIQARNETGEYTLLRVVRSTRYDYARLVAVHRLVEELAAGELGIDDATVRLREITGTRRNFPTWAVTLGNALLASAVAVMIGASAVAAAVTVVVVLGVSIIARFERRMALPDFYANAFSAFAATLLAWAFYALGAIGWLPLRESDFAFVVAGGIVAMLPGRTMAAAIEDVLFGYPLTGAGRLLGVLLSTMGIIIGIGGGLTMMLRITEWTGASFVSPAVLELRPSSSSLVAVVIGAFVVGLTAAVIGQSRHRLILPTAVLTLAAALAQAAMTRWAGFGPVVATGIAAVLLGVVGRLVAQRMRAPALVLVVPASFGLLPGLTIFRGMYELVAGADDKGLLTIQSALTTLATAVAILLAIATGTVLGDFLAAPWDERMRRGRWRRRGPAADVRGVQTEDQPPVEQ